MFSIRICCIGFRPVIAHPLQKAVQSQDMVYNLSLDILYVGRD